MEDKVLLEVKPTWKSLIPHILLMFIAIGFLTIWKPLFSLISTKLTITEKRVSGKVGLIKTQTMDSPKAQITSVKVEQGLFGKICGYGTLFINTAAGNYAFGGIEKPESVKNVIINSTIQ